MDKTWKCAGTFAIGFFGGVCAVFVPRMGGLLVAEDLFKISVFPMPFIIMGGIYALVIGIVIAILFYGKDSTPADRFMTSLGIPALLAGAISASAQTGHVKSLQADNGRLAEIARTAEKIQKNDAPVEIVPLRPAPNGSVIDLVPIAAAHAQSAQAGSGTWRTWGAIQGEEPRYAIVVDRTPNEQQAVQRARTLQADFPDAQAVRLPQGFGVITGVKAESAAVLEAVRIKRESTISPELMRVK